MEAAPGPGRWRFRLRVAGGRRYGVARGAAGRGFQQRRRWRTAPHRRHPESASNPIVADIAEITRRPFRDMQPAELRAGPLRGGRPVPHRGARIGRGAHEPRRQYWPPAGRMSFEEITDHIGKSRSAAQQMVERGRERTFIRHRCSRDQDGPIRSVFMLRLRPVNIFGTGPSRRRPTPYSASHRDPPGLAELNPDRYRPDLATSLSNLGARYSELGRLEEAAAIQDEVERL